MNLTNYNQEKHINYTTDNSMSYDKKENIKFDETSFSISGGERTRVGDYVYILPNDINIFKNFENIENIKNKNVKNQVVIFLAKFQNILIAISNRLDFTGSLPPLLIQAGEDGSALIEWIFKDFRIGFAFEENEKESSWYLVSNQKFGNIDISGSFKNVDVYNLLEQTITSVLVNR